MQITEVRIRPANEEFVRAYASICFDDCFVVYDIRVIEAPTGLFIFPTKKLSDGTHWDIAYPANAETRRMIERAGTGGVREMDWKYFGVSNDETGIGEYYGNAVCLAVYVRRRNYDGCRDMSSGVRARASKTTTRNRRAKTQSTVLPASRLRKASIGGIINDEKQGTHREDFLPVKRT